MKTKTLIIAALCFASLSYAQPLSEQKKYHPTIETLSTYRLTALALFLGGIGLGTLYCGYKNNLAIEALMRAHIPNYDQIIYQSHLRFAPISYKIERFLPRLVEASLKNPNLINRLNWLILSLDCSITVSLFSLMGAVACTAFEFQDKLFLTPRKNIS